MGLVTHSVALGHELLQAVTQGLLGGQAEDSFGGLVIQDDPLAFVHRDDRIHGRIQQCIREQSACRGYQFHFERQDRKRQGNFLLDFLNFKRDTYVTGWWFDALVVVSDGLVLFRNYGGQAATDRVEKQTNPLGPLQPSGEAAGAYLLH